jgi:hypothetical protein
VVSVEESRSTPASGYALVLPPGWARIPLRTGTEQTIDAIVDRTFSGLPRDQVASFRRDLQLRLRELTAAARRGNGLDVYLPTERLHGFTAAASFVVAEVAFDSTERLEPAMLIARLTDAEDSSPVQVGGVVGVRSERVAARRPDGGEDFGSRRVDYAFPVPGNDDRWVLVSFSTIGQGDPADALADLLVELFDAIMTTFRWRAS